MIIRPGVVGIDVSKRHLDLFDPRGGARRIANEPEAVALLAQACATAGDFVAFEATGSYDGLLRRALDAAGVRFARVNPQKARDFARAAGFLAKTDAVDARMLAAMAQALAPPAEPPADPVRDRLAALVKRRDQLVAMRAQERVRRSESLHPALTDDLDAHLDWLDERVAGLEAEIRAHVKQSARLAADVERLKTAPGVGPVTAVVLTALMPELGARSGKTVAALAGLAPLNADSGQLRGQRRIRGGRRRVRAALYMAAVSAIRVPGRFADLYRRLRTVGKAAKVALVAVARRLLVVLNAMVRDQAAYAP